MTSQRIPSCSAPWTARRPCATPYRLAVDDQLRAGLDLITDGEMQRVDFNLGFYEYLEGLEPLRRPAAGAPRPTISATAIGASHRSRHRKGWGWSTEYRRLREMHPAPVKVPVPGPFTLAGCIEGGDVYARPRRPSPRR